MAKRGSRSRLTRDLPSEPSMGGNAFRVARVTRQVAETLDDIVIEPMPERPSARAGRIAALERAGALSDRNITPPSGSAGGVGVRGRGAAKPPPPPALRLNTGRDAGVREHDDRNSTELRDRRPLCKERPDNREKRGAGQGPSRAFIPWCNKK